MKLYIIYIVAFNEKITVKPKYVLYFSWVLSGDLQGENGRGEKKHK